MEKVSKAKLIFHDDPVIVLLQRVRDVSGREIGHDESACGKGLMQREAERLGPYRPKNNNIDVIAYNSLLHGVARCGRRSYWGVLDPHLVCIAQP